MAWEVIVLRDAERVLRRAPRDLQERLIAAIDSLAITPRPHGCKKLIGHENLYRIRVGDWRIVYAIEDARLIVLILEVAPRGGAYKGL